MNDISGVDMYSTAISQLLSDKYALMRELAAARDEAAMLREELERHKQTLTETLRHGQEQQAKADAEIHRLLNIAKASGRLK